MTPCIGSGRLVVRTRPPSSAVAAPYQSLKVSQGPRSGPTIRPQLSLSTRRNGLVWRPVAAALTAAAPSASPSIWVKLWSFISMAASCLAAAAATAFVFTQQVKLLAGPICLPVVALVASREAQRCLAQVCSCLTVHSVPCLDLCQS